MSVRRPPPALPAEIIDEIFLQARTAGQPALDIAHLSSYALVSRAWFLRARLLVERSVRVCGGAQARRVGARMAEGAGVFVETHVVECWPEQEVTRERGKEKEGPWGKEEVLPPTKQEQERLNLVQADDFVALLKAMPRVRSLTLVRPPFVRLRQRDVN